jgi:T4 superinfection immunity protein
VPETANVWTVVGNAAGPTFDVVALVTVGLILVGAYFLPTIVANVRKPSPPNVGSVVVINLFLGWTWIGWVVALALACRSAARSDGGSQDQRLTYPGAAGRRA